MEAMGLRNAARILWAAILCLFPAALPAQEGERPSIRTRGPIVSASTVEVRSQAPGQTTILHLVPEGTRVRKGDLLIQMDASGLEDDLLDRRAQVEAARADVAAAEQFLTAARDESGASIELAERELTVADGALRVFTSGDGEFALQVRLLEIEAGAVRRRIEAATAHLERMKEGAASAADREEVALALAEAKGQLEMVEAKRNYLEKGLRPQRIADLELAVARRKLDLIRARSGAAAGLRKGEAESIAARSRLRSAEIALERAERRLAACKVFAPQDGMVVYAAASASARSTAVRIDEGAVVREGQIIMSIHDVERLEIRGSADEKDVLRIQPGQMAVIRIDALPDHELQGRVVAVGTTPYTSGRPRLYAVRIAIDDPSGGLRPGMTGIASILVDAEKPREE
ncbi:MAG: efflux RND transporter periplasmic adaptor subunit [Planctomycetes bacterium]|nr:efflux RND transporter periplasmic adaptor subunit [Planctomycetota bacterium]